MKKLACLLVLIFIPVFCKGELYFIPLKNGILSIKTPSGISLNNALSFNGDNFSFSQYVVFQFVSDHDVDVPWSNEEELITMLVNEIENNNFYIYNSGSDTESKFFEIAENMQSFVHTEEYGILVDEIENNDFYIHNSGSDTESEFSEISEDESTEDESTEGENSIVHTEEYGDVDISSNSDDGSSESSLSNTGLMCMYSCGKRFETSNARRIHHYRSHKRQKNQLKKQLEHSPRCLLCNVHIHDMRTLGVHIYFSHPGTTYLDFRL